MYKEQALFQNCANIDVHAKYGMPNFDLFGTLYYRHCCVQLKWFQLSRQLSVLDESVAMP